MIVFDLACRQGHVFEAWFGSSADYDDQCGRGLVACPICGSGELAKAVMAPNVAPKGNKAALPVNMRGGAPAAGDMKAMLAMLAKAQAKVLEGSEHVGKRFATEARAIYDGEAPERAIHGQATPEEVRSLAEDGVQVAALPLPVIPPEAAN